MFPRKIAQFALFKEGLHPVVLPTTSPIYHIYHIQTKTPLKASDRGGNCSLLPCIRPSCTYSRASDIPTSNPRTQETAASNTDVLKINQRRAPQM